MTAKECRAQESRKVDGVSDSLARIRRDREGDENGRGESSREDGGSGDR